MDGTSSMSAVGAEEGDSTADIARARSGSNVVLSKRRRQSQQSDGSPVRMCRGSELDLYLLGIDYEELHPDARSRPSDAGSAESVSRAGLVMDTSANLGALPSDPAMEPYSASFPQNPEEHAARTFVPPPQTPWSVYREKGFGAAAKWTVLHVLTEHWGVLLLLVFSVIALVLLGTLSFDPLNWKGWMAICVTLLMLILLIKNSYPTHIVMLAAVTVLLAFTVITPQQALIGFGNVGVGTVAILFAVAEGIQRTSLLRPLFRVVLGKGSKLFWVQLRLFASVAVVSAFLNNTPVVAMLVPIIEQWCRTAGVPASKILMPMNDATILGGTVTLLGTSTNLIVVGLAQEAKLEDQEGNPLSFGIFGISPAGVPYCVIGILYLLIASHFLLRDRRSGTNEVLQNPREYTVALKVESKSPIVGETIQEAGLRQLEGLFLVQLTREDGETFSAPPPDHRLEGGDVILFAGVVDTVRELYLIPGLVPATAETQKIQAERHRRRLVELVLSGSSSMVGMTVKESHFRTRYHAAIIAIHRHGERVVEKIGSIELRAGDVLLIECGEEFVELNKHNHNFALVSEVSKSQPPRSDLLHMIIAGTLAVLMIAISTAGLLPLFTTALIALFGMVILGCLTFSEAGRAVSIPVLLMVACSFAVSEGLSGTGAASEFANFMVSVFDFSQVGLLLGIYLGTAMLSAVITNNAAVSLFFPIIADPQTGIIYTQNMNPYAALYVMMFAASSSFSTPIGYQTNLMVHGPGGYTFVDWVIFGVPLQLILCPVSVLLCYFMFPSK
ncbi:putative sulfur deprivation response regulator [Porphyridium purpureum]|uniref:Putative sulfur deprivation response regulator n=1 Tax=Porphyridium purpureum TaxID=35688 RepID=A0A5J4YUE3_PORPP|nr:putative sulfur deprivation response regulator [Porphyridium purpureum]|eukprot:POR9083..scf227_4